MSDTAESSQNKPKDHLSASQIDQQSKDALHKVDSGDKVGLAQLLNNLSPEDALKIAQELQKMRDQERQKDTTLPKLEISTGTELSGTKVLLDISKREERLYGLRSDLLTSIYHSQLEKNRDGSTSYLRLDPNTGRPVSEEISYLDATTTSIQDDPVIGKPKTIHISHQDGSSFHQELDPATGFSKSEDIVNSDGSIAHTEFLPTGNPSTAHIHKDKTTVDIKYDQTTGNPITANAISDNKKTTEQRVYDPATGKIKTKHVEHLDGPTVDEYTEYNLNTGQPNFTNIKNRDSSQDHVEYDSATGKIKFKETVLITGSKGHYDYDPVTQKPISATLHNADKSIAKIKYDPVTGHMKMQNITYQDGSTADYEYDAASGKPVSVHIISKNEESTIDESFDPSTGNPVSIDITHKNGSKEHHRFDPDSGEELPNIIKSA